MAIHRKLQKSTIESLCDIVLGTQATVQSDETATNGTISVTNADGTRTVIGVGAGTDETGGSNGTAYFVGDTTPPSAPIGLNFVTGDGCITGIWGGELEDGMPADFARVEFRYIDDSTDDATYVAFGSVSVPGSATSEPLTAEQTYTCYAVAYDVQGNVSDDSETTEIEVVDAEAIFSEVAESAAAAQEAAEQAAADVETLSAELTEVTTTVDGLKTTVEGYVTDEDLAESLSAYSTTDQTATMISDAVSAVLYDDDGNEVYATSSSVEQTATDILSAVAATYATTTYVDGVETDITSAYTSAIDQSATEILSTVSETYLTSDDAAATYATTSVLSQTAEKITASVEAVADTADAAVTKATEVETNLEGFKATVSKEYATKDELDAVEDKADEANDAAASAYSAATALYGTCATAASTAAKVVACDDFTLFSGASIAVTFTYANTAGAVSLNVNDTGAVYVYVSGAAASTSNYLLWSAGTTIEFTYNGTYWLYAGGATSYTCSCTTAAATATKTATQSGAVICSGTNAEVTWTYGNSYVDGALTFNLGSTAAKTLYYGSDATSSDNAFEVDAGEVIGLVFDGAYWCVSDSASLTRNASLAVTVNSIDAEVSSVYETTGYSLSEIADLAITAEGITSTVSAVTSLASAQTGANLLQDGGFEAADYWTGLPDGMSLDADNPHSGTYSMACTGATNSAYLNHPVGEDAKSSYTSISVEDGETYRISAWCMASEDAVWANNNTKVRVGLTDGNDTLITALDASFVTAGDGWTYGSTTWTNNKGYAEVQIRLVELVTSGTVWWDDIRFEVDTATMSYVDATVSSAVTQTAEDITATFTETLDGYAKTTLIRESADGVEVAKIDSDGEYSSTKALIDDTGFHVQDSDGNELSSFESDMIELGKNNSDAGISFCNNAGALKAYQYDSGDYSYNQTYFLVNGDIGDQRAIYFSEIYNLEEGIDSAYESDLGLAIMFGDTEKVYMSMDTEIAGKLTLPTTNGRIYSYSTNLGYTHYHGTTGYGVSLGVGSGGYNRGVYDHTNDGWMIYSPSTTTRLCIGNAFANFVPQTTDNTTLGSASYLWKKVYASSSSISTSDARQKTSIVDVDTGTAAAIVQGLRPITYTRTSESAMGRTHYGYIAQEVEELITGLGISTFDFSPLVKDPVDENGEELSDEEYDNAADYIYSLRYEEFIPILTSVIQQQKTQIEALTARVEALEAQANG